MRVEKKFDKQITVKKDQNEVDGVIKASLYLFNAYPLLEVRSVKEKEYYTNENLFRHGLVFHKRLEDIEETVLHHVRKVFPRDKVHNTFWSFKETIERENDGSRIFVQILHYFSTYGLEFLTGRAVPFIPNEKYGKELEGIIKKRLVIHALGAMDLVERVQSLLQTSVGLSKLQVYHASTLIRHLVRHSFLELSADEVLSIKNRDLMVQLIKDLDVQITDADTLIRYLVGLRGLRKVKNRIVLEFLRHDAEIGTEFIRHIIRGGEDLIHSMARSFYRNKGYFLALKNNHAVQNSEENPVVRNAVNRARKLAKKMYSPVFPEHIMLIKSDEFAERVKKSPLPKLVRYYQYLLKSERKAGIFFIRNGKVWLEENWEPEYTSEKYSARALMLHEEISRRIENIFAGVVFHPQHRIALPSSATNFIGNVPAFSEYTFNSNSVAIGIHWYDTREDRVDLDLHLYDIVKDQRIGWNASWTEGDRITFSGDMTAAPPPHGAAEYMAILYNEIGKEKESETFIYLQVNDYMGNVYQNPSYTFSFVILEGEEEEEVSSFIEKIRGEHVSLLLPLTFGEKQSIALGYVIGKRFIFFPLSFQRGRVFRRFKGNVKTGLEMVKRFLRAYPRIHDFNVPVDEENGITFQNLTTEFWDPYWRS